MGLGCVLLSTHSWPTIVESPLTQVDQILEHLSVM